MPPGLRVSMAEYEIGRPLRDGLEWAASLRRQHHKLGRAKSHSKSSDPNHRLADHECAQRFESRDAKRSVVIEASEHSFTPTTLSRGRRPPPVLVNAV